MKREALKNLPCNTLAILQFRNKTIDGAAVTVNTRVVGVVPDSSVMIAWENTQQWAGLREVLVENEPVVLRIVDSSDSKGRVFALKTNIRRVLHEPSRVIFLDYPHKSDLQLADIRSGSRIKVDIPAKLVEAETGKFVGQGVLTDISKNGCGFKFSDRQHTPIDNDGIYRVVINNDKDEMSIDIQPKKNDIDSIGGLYVSSNAHITEFTKFAAVIFVNRELLS